jgi:hypothetical protein
MMEMVISPGGTVRCIYGEEIDLSQLGQVDILRASHVEPDVAGAWWTDMAPVNGPKLGPFQKRSAALEAEVQWLRQHVLRSEH